ncbi:type I-E CRISPR-associated protein Cas5/CasD [Proteinivorax hydrogeniformans]|uniref:Type I-E CRISPR-associated protein Cas5/CasD n=1 Tax=Proteinivorax hydrogeniformans TaxID=1826727 RepID=A0AAU8HV86_9FIRM
MKTILLKFSGPLQSWGTTSHFETRQTDRYPSKSAVIGMIAASLGYRREETQNIQKLNDLNFGVRIDQTGVSIQDYQIAKKYKKNGELERTYVTNRYYLEDAVFVVAVGHKNHQFMNMIEEGLKRPYFQQFLGRRSAPLAADFFLGSTKTDIEESLKKIDWQAANWYQRSNSSTLTAYVDSDLLTEGATRTRHDRVKSFSQRNREFGYRGERRIEISVNTNNETSLDNVEEHNAFDSIGG